MLQIKRNGSKGKTWSKEEEGVFFLQLFVIFFKNTTIFHIFPHGNRIFSMRSISFSVSLKYAVFVILFGFLSPTSGYFKNNEEVQVSDAEQSEAVAQLLHRLIGEKANQFHVKVNSNLESEDVCQISAKDGKIFVTGNKAYSVAAGIHQYLKFYCGCHVSWSGNQLKLPETLPLPIQTMNISFTDRYRYYQNVCTSSYSYVWWTWDRWEREIDWMALNGINLALAFNAQEAIYFKVFKSLNFTDHDINVFFTGPAFLAWNRMGNVQAWVGPLSQNWHDDQIQLQHQILDRMRSFGMTSVLPAFSGRVLPAFERIFPDANVTYLNKTWGHFQPPYAFVNFLEPTDPIFQEIGSEFLKTYIDEFGTDHIYNADLFNEMPPPSDDPSYLQSCAKSLFKSLVTVDPQAIWMIQGWMFYSDPDIWKEEQSRAFLRSVPLGKMIVLDLQSELYPQYQRLSSYFGQPFIWCMLHNYGGVSGLYGSLDSINKGPFEARKFEGSTMIGTGLTPEGIETNDIAYELMNEVGLMTTPTDLHEWLADYARRRYNSDSGLLDLAYLYLRRSVYNASAPYRNHGSYILIRRPSFKLKPYIWYNPKDVFVAWELFLNASDDSVVNKSKLYRHDLVDLGRQSLQLAMDVLYPSIVQSFRSKNITSLRDTSQRILSLFDDMNELLASDENFLLGRWLQAALSKAKTPLEARQYEFNARNQITLWGPSGQIIDYANKQWAGLMSHYYRRRWKLFFDTLENCLSTGRRFKQADFNQEVFTRVEYDFNMGQEKHSTTPEGDSLQISKRLFQKYGKILEE